MHLLEPSPADPGAHNEMTPPGRLMPLNQLAQHITAWREGKGFVTPSTLSEHHAPEPMTGADLLLAHLMEQVNAITDTAQQARRGAFQGEEAYTLLTHKEQMQGKLMLVVTEVSEASMAVEMLDEDAFGEEVADVFIRLLDICGAAHIDIEALLAAKMEKIAGRPLRHGKANRL